MKRFFIIAAIATLLVCALAVSASAIADIEYNLVTVDEDTGIYKITATLNNESGTFGTYKNDITFDYGLIIPVSAKTGKVAPITTSPTVKTPVKVLTYFDEINEEDAEVTHSPASPTWTVDGTTATLVVETYYAGETAIDSNNIVVFEMYFKFADGKSASDISETSFVVDYIMYADNVTGIETYNSETETEKNTLTVVNNVYVPATVNTISVAAGSTVYFVDGTAVLYNEDTEVEVPAEAGLIYVNTGYDAHTVYAVDAEGVPTKVTGLDNAILGSAGASIRTSGVQGIRFRASVSNTAKDLGLATSEYEIAEYGFIVTAETNKTGFDSNSDFLGMNLVEAGKAKKGVAYNKADGTDIVFAEETDSTIFTNVVKNIPLTKSALQANIVSRPYYIITDGETETVLYGELTKKSVYGVAVAIKEVAGAAYTDNKDYIDNIISIVEGTQVAELTTEISIDISKLYE